MPLPEQPAPRVPIAWFECPTRKSARGIEPDFDLSGLDGEASYSDDGNSCILTIYAGSKEALEGAEVLSKSDSAAASVSKSNFERSLEAGTFKTLNGLKEPKKTEEASK
jgi:hypothetical protein